MPLITVSFIESLTDTHIHTDTLICDSLTGELSLNAKDKSPGSGPWVRPLARPACASISPDRKNPGK
jgi:hypothetical protein